MKWILCFAGAMFIAISCAQAGEPSRLVKLPKDTWELPDLELRGRLGEAVEFSNCERVSGLTCTIELKKGQALPSRILVQEVYAGGGRRGRQWALIYPQLLPGEKGKATFLKMKGVPQRLILSGVWSGEWVDQY